MKERNGFETQLAFVFLWFRLIDVNTLSLSSKVKRCLKNVRLSFIPMLFRIIQKRKPTAFYIIKTINETQVCLSCKYIASTQPRLLQSRDSRQQQTITAEIQASNFRKEQKAAWNIFVSNQMSSCPWTMVVQNNIMMYKSVENTWCVEFDLKKSPAEWSKK